MLFWTDELKRLGFRAKADRYWRCDRGYGLDGATHLSMFVWTRVEQISGGLACYDVCEFHVTFEVPRHNLHFYYHETWSNVWAPAGHTSTAEVAQLGLDVESLQLEADTIAAHLVTALGGALRPRNEEC